MLGHNREYEICSLETRDGTHKNSLGSDFCTQNGALGVELFSALGLQVILHLLVSYE